MMRAMPLIWLLPTAYLALWSLVMGGWSFVDGEGLFRAFGLDLTGDPFVMMNSGARYLGVAAALTVAVIWRHPVAVLTALAARFVMDLGDVVAGLATGMLDPVVTGLVQSAVLFFIPTGIGAWLAWRWLGRARAAALSG